MSGWARSWFWPYHIKLCHFLFNFFFPKVVISLDLQLLSQITILQTVFKQSIITCFNFSSVPAGTLIIAIVLVFKAGHFKNRNASGGNFNFQCLWNILHHFLFSFFPWYSADTHRVSQKILRWLLQEVRPSGEAITRKGEALGSASTSHLILVMPSA